MFKVDKQLNYGRSIIDQYLSMLNINNCLDVGAGAGEDLDFVRFHHPKASLYGIEYYDEYARKLEAKNIQTIRVDFETSKLPFEDEYLDLIISNQMLEHSKEVFWVLHEMSRCLKIGGHLIIGVPNLASLHNRLLLMVGRQPTCIQNDSAHIRGYTKSDLLKLLNIFPGYKLKEFKGSNFYPFSPALAKPLAKMFPGLSWGIFFLLEKVSNYQGQYLIHPVTNQLETKFYLGQNE